MGIPSNLLPYRLPTTEGGRLIDPHVVIVGAGSRYAGGQLIRGLSPRETSWIVLRHSSVRPL